MQKYISLLRGINVSGQKKIKMDALKTLYESLGFQHVQTYIQSGNVVFEHTSSNASNLAKTIEVIIKRKLGFDVSVFIRTKEEFAQVIQHNPFQDKDSTKLYVIFLSSASSSDATKDIKQAATKMEAFALSGKEIYLFCPDGYGRTKLNNNFFEKIFNTPATTRNWRTINTLATMAV